MANSPQARKRARQSVKRRAHNIDLHSKMRTSVKKVYIAIEAGDKAAASVAYKAASQLIDKMVPKGILHKNAAARYKRNMNSRIKQLG